ncbi:MAG: DUF1684 domain-containing protein [Halodesulfurarchaeum sp.]
MTEEPATDTEWADLIRHHREEKQHTFTSAEGTPLSERALSAFDGLEFFPIDPDFRLTGRLEPFEDAREGTLEATRGPPMPFEHVGQLGIELGGELAVLEVYRATGADALLLPFRDETNGRETWEHGRYVNISAPGESERGSRIEVTVDFNLAYHPLCVHDPTVRSAKPPAENEIRASVRAGERR